MKTTGEYLSILRGFKAAKAIQYSIASIGIFGSVARGEQTEGSDVDICVSLNKPSMFNMVHIKDDLEQLFGCQVDIVRMRDDMDSFSLTPKYNGGQHLCMIGRNRLNIF